MLGEIAPMQFIEGINEGDRNTDQYQDLQNARGVAVEYTPKITYSLKSLEINFSCQADAFFCNAELSLATSYKDLPSNIKLCEGSLISESNLYIPKWWLIEFKKPAVVLKGWKYWICIIPKELTIQLPITETGENIPLRFYTGDKWFSSDRFKTTNSMLKFYGRIPPTIN